MLTQLRTKLQQQGCVVHAIALVVAYSLYSHIYYIINIVQISTPYKKNKTVFPVPMVLKFLGQWYVRVIFLYW